MDVNQITSSLRMMGDQQLQQYAAMHKADPYILSLAVSESNQRKQMRAEQMAKMSGQKPPTVVEQDIQGMAPPPQISHDLPEHQGIGALPAQNMQRMADGGIAGYADGDMIAQSEPVVRMAGGGLNGDLPEGFQSGRLYSDAFPVQAAPPTQAPQAPQASSGSYWDPNTGALVDAEEVPRLSFGERLQRALGIGEGTKLNPERVIAGELGRRAGDDTETARHSHKRDSAGTTQETTQSPPRSNARKPVSEVGSSSVRQRSSTTSTGIAALPAAKAKTYSDPYKAMSDDEVDAIVKRRANASNEEMDAAYKPFTEEFAKDKEALAKRKQDNVGMAILQAGLGMMGGKSQYALQNIGEGAQKGLAVYQEAQKADDDARRALRQSEMMLMQAQRAERSGNRKDAVELFKDSEMAKRYASESAAKRDELRDTDEFRQGQLAAEKQKIALQAEHNKIQAAAANKTPPEIQYIERYAKDRGMSFADAAESVAGMRRDPQTKEVLMKAWSGNVLLQQQYPNPQDYLRIMTAASAGTSADMALVNKYLPKN